MRAAPVLFAVAVAVGLWSAPLVASADVGPAPKKKGCAVEAAAGEPSEGRTAAFALCAAALVGAVAVRRARRAK